MKAATNHDAHQRDDLDLLFINALAEDAAPEVPGAGFRRRVCRLAQEARQASRIVPTTPLDRHALSPATIEAGHEQTPAQAFRF